MKTQCPNCKTVFYVPDEYRSQTIKCVACKESLTATVFREESIVSSQHKSISKLKPTPIKCSNCGSTQIMGGKKGFSGGKALLGGVLLGGVGLLAGLHGSKKVVITCLNCGHKWQVGK